MPSNPPAPSRPDLGAPGSHQLPEARPRHRGGAPLLLFVILAAQLMVVLDTTIVNVALPHIQAGLSFSSNGLSWVLNAYILTFGGLLLLGARAGDLLGRRRVLLGGIAVFALSSLAGGLAVTSWMLLAARAVQGLGAALAAPSALSLLTTAFEDGPARVKAIGLYTTVSAAGGAVGLVAGGVLTELVSWRAVMFVNVPIGVLVWLLGRVVVPESKVRRGRFDAAGALSSTAGMTGLVFGLVHAGSSGWTSPYAIGPMLGGAGLLAFFVHHEGRVPEPILPLRLLTHTTRSAANGARGLLYAGMYGLFFFLTIFFQDVQGFSPLSAGLAFLPMPAAVFLGSQLTSRVLVRRLPEKTVMVAGAMTATFGALLASRIGPSTPYLPILASIALMGSGMGISFVSLTSASLAEVAPEDAGAASGLVNVAQQLGGAVGLAVLISVFGALTAHHRFGIAHLTHPSAVAAAAASAALVHALDDVFRVAVLFGLGALALLVAGVRRPHRPLRVVPMDGEPVRPAGSWAEEQEAS